MHSPFKQPTAARLARAGLSIAYNIDVGTTGPIPGAVTRTGTTLTLTVENLGPGTAGVQLRGDKGFEVLIGGKWEVAQITTHTKATVTLSDVPKTATKLRYNWYSNPCGEGEFGCAVYIAVEPLGKLSGEEPFLPLPPFVKAI